MPVTVNDVTITEGAGTDIAAVVYANADRRQVVVIASPNDATSATVIADVKGSAPGTTEVGLIVRLVAEAIAGAIFSKITDGTDTAEVKAAAPAGADNGLVVRILAEAIGSALFAKVTDGTDTLAIDASGNAMVALGAALDNTSAPTIADGATPSQKIEIASEDTARTNLV